jgi:hypothetical protein
LFVNTITTGGHNIATHRRRRRRRRRMKVIVKQLWQLREVD